MIKKYHFEQLAEQKIDAIITREDGSQVPANTFFYGILNDSSIIENEFDKYLGDGAWRDFNQAFEQLYDPNISKEKFDLVFKSAQGLIQEFANVRYLDKHKEAVTRNGGFNNIPNLIEYFNNTIYNLELKLNNLEGIIPESLSNTINNLKVQMYFY